MHISRERVAELVEYRDGNLYWKVDQGRVKKGMLAGCVCGRYRKVMLDKKLYSVSRVIYFLHHGDLPEVVDHINGNTQDNRIVNLRGCTQAENVRNASTPCTNSSGIKGVYWHKRDKRWLVRLSINGKTKYFGSFADKEEARKHAEEMRIKHYGEFARHI